MTHRLLRPSLPWMILVAWLTGCTPEPWKSNLPPLDEANRARQRLIKLIERCFFQNRHYRSQAIDKAYVFPPTDKGKKDTETIS